MLPPETSLLLLIILCGAVVSAELARTIAKAKGLDGGGWGVAGFFFGPIGLIGVAGMPDRRLRYYMRSIAVKLEAIELQDVESIETINQLPFAVTVANNNELQFFYVDSSLNNSEQIVASVLNQFPEEDRASLSAQRSDVTIGRTSFIFRRDGRLYARLKYIDLQDGKHVFQRM